MRRGLGRSIRQLLAEARTVTDPMELLKFPPRFSRRIYEAEIPVENLLRGAGMVAPELAAVEDEANCQRYDSQVMVIDALERGGVAAGGVEPGCGAGDSVVADEPGDVSNACAGARVDGG